MAKSSANKKRKRSDASAVLLRTGTTLDGSSDDKHVELLDIVTLKTDAKKDSEHVSEPLLTLFPQGCIPAVSEEFGLLRHSEPRKAKQRLLFGQTDKVEYSGKNYGGIDRSSNKTARYLIFRYDDKRKEAVLLNRDPLHQTLYEMKQTVLNVRKESQARARKEAMTKSERRRKLVDEFGSRKKQNAYKSSDAAKVSSTQVISAGALESLLEENVKNESENKPTEDALLASRRKLLPPFSLTATTTEKIYPLSSLLPIAVTAALKPKLMEVLKARKSNQNVNYSELIGELGSFVKSCVSRLEHINDRKRARVLLRQLLFIHYMFKFLEIKGRFFKKSTLKFKATRHKIPVEILVLLSDMFGEKTNDAETKLITKLSKDRLTLHALTLCLHVDQFTISGEKINLISQDLKVNKDDIQKFCRELGCKSLAVKGSRDRTVVLTAPLKFEPQKTGGMRGR